ncbi:MAG: hypothetical protein HN368_21445, partial [Spirochaetales bacterium]|nr:hypothetical protein [Spirochaetales bacterium]
MELSESDFAAMDGESCIFLSWPNISDQQDGAKAISYAGIRTYEADSRFYDQYLIENQVFGSTTISGNPEPGRLVDWVFLNPEVSASEWIPKLSVLSIDIENNPATSEILSISLASDATWRDEKVQQVLFSYPEANPPIEDTRVSCFIGEKDLLEHFKLAIADIDPDIITGWNVLEFDFLHIFNRFQFHNIPFTLGRSDQAGNFLPGGKGQSSAVIIPGRQVLDAMRIMRAGPMRFDDNRLETVASEVLGSGKVRLSDEPELRGQKKIDQLLETYRENPAKFCEYSLLDSILVIDILEKTGLMELTIRRAGLTGVGLARAWTSVASFEHMYISAMHRSFIAAPTHGVDSFEVSSAPGGAIIPPQPGLYKNVLVYDFKSLYPSIMRTFNIDPVSYVSGQSKLKPGEIDDLIKAPNGVFFRRSTAILPVILQGFFEKREEAKKKNDPIASYVYKIIMNSFYGVLGTSGCRFAASDIAGAITSFGHHFLSWCQNNLETLGNRVIYGDTDSLFVLLNPETDTWSTDRLEKAAQKIADDLNYKLQRNISEHWRLESKLELEFEGMYTRFFLPPIRVTTPGPRSSEEPPQLRGRAKGYAGMKLVRTIDSGAETVLDIKGMEAVRRDWTIAAKDLQVGVLSRVFEDATTEDLRTFIRTYIANLRLGKYDSGLIYRKALR